jgi:hypothetical protein
MTFDVPASPCPNCGHVSNLAATWSSIPIEVGAPLPGDLGFCVDCGGVHVYGDTLTKRVPTKSEAVDIDADPQIARLREAWVQVRPGAR